MVYIPMAARIAVELAAAICSGEIQPGEPLPSRRQMMADHSVAINTATEAVRKLVRAGLAHGRQGAGTYAMDISTTPVGQVLAAAQACRAAAAGEWEDIPDGLSCVNQVVLRWMAEAFTVSASLMLDNHHVVDVAAVAAAQAVCNSGR